MAWAATRTAINLLAEEALKDYTTMALHVTAESERDLCEMGIGARVAQGQYPLSFVSAFLTFYAAPTEALTEHMVSETQLEASWRALGITPGAHSWSKFIPEINIAHSSETAAGRTPCLRVPSPVQMRSREHDGLLHPPRRDRGRDG